MYMNSVSWFWIFPAISRILNVKSIGVMRSRSISNADVLKYV